MGGTINTTLSESTEIGEIPAEVKPLFDLAIEQCRALGPCNVFVTIVNALLSYGRTLPEDCEAYYILAIWIPLMQEAIRNASDKETLFLRDVE